VLPLALLREPDEQQEDEHHDQADGLCRRHASHGRRRRSGVNHPTA
jgi:hypothetical protein